MSSQAWVKANSGDDETDEEILEFQYKFPVPAKEPQNSLLQQNLESEKKKEQNLVSEQEKPPNLKLPEKSKLEQDFSVSMETLDFKNLDFPDFTKKFAKTTVYQPESKQAFKPYTEKQTVKCPITTPLYNEERDDDIIDSEGPVSDNDDDNLSTRDLELDDSEVDDQQVSDSKLKENQQDPEYLDFLNEGFEENLIYSEDVDSESDVMSSEEHKPNFLEDDEDSEASEKAILLEFATLCSDYLRRLPHHINFIYQKRDEANLMTTLISVNINDKSSKRDFTINSRLRIDTKHKEILAAISESLYNLKNLKYMAETLVMIPQQLKKTMNVETRDKLLREEKVYSTKNTTVGLLMSVLLGASGLIGMCIAQHYDL
jgi:hypothetical protein